MQASGLHTPAPTREVTLLQIWDLGGEELQAA